MRSGRPKFTLTEKTSEAAQIWDGFLYDLDQTTLYRANYTTRNVELFFSLLFFVLFSYILVVKGESCV